MTLKKLFCTKRDYTNFNIEQFLQDISHCFHNFSVSDLNVSVENYWLLWKKLFNDICEQHAPLYYYKVRPKGRPWINKNIINMMRERDRVHRYAIRRKDPIMLTLYKQLRNQCNFMIKLSKFNYIQNEINNNSGNDKIFWNIVKTLTGDKRSTNPIPHDLSNEDLNLHFSSVGSTLAQTFSTDLPEWNAPECIYSLSLTQIFNLTLTQNYIPSDWKKAKITPIYKGKGSKLDPSNYRPISVVPHIAKILEKHVYSLCYNYLENHDLLTVDQSAFLQKHSTITSLHKVNDEWLESIENGEYIAVSFFDVKKCFDTLNHDVLFLKMKKIWIFAELYF